MIKEIKKFVKDVVNKSKNYNLHLICVTDHQPDLKESDGFSLQELEKLAERVKKLDEN